MLETGFSLLTIPPNSLTFSPQGLVEELRRLLEKYLDKVLDFKKKNCQELVPAAELNLVASLCRLFDSLGTEENGVSVLMLLA